MNDKNPLDLAVTAAAQAPPDGEPPQTTVDADPPAIDVADLRRERDDYFERWRRTAAEFDNHRKRVDRERREQAEAAAADLLRDLLPIVDDFERALQVDAASSPDAYRRGVELIYRQMIELLRKAGATPIQSVGTTFDPRFHQAVNAESSPGREGEILEEYRRGYMLGDRLLRPAMVKVAQA
jgi:molecular chaperone GrpE